MPFCNNNNLFSNLPCSDWMQKPLQISEGGSPKGTSTSQSRGDQLCKFIGTKESFKWKKCSSPTGMVWHVKIAIVLLFWDTKGAFDWEIWIYGAKKYLGRGLSVLTAREMKREPKSERGRRGRGRGKKETLADSLQTNPSNAAPDWLG